MDAYLSLLMNLHLHRLTLERILHLLQSIDVHLRYWRSHTSSSSLPAPYRVFKYVQAKWNGAKVATSNDAQQAGRRDGQRVDLATIPPTFSARHSWHQLAQRNARELRAMKKRWTRRCGTIAVRMQHISVWLTASFGDEVDCHSQYCRVNQYQSLHLP
jgi:hypothetical protein